MRRSLVRIVIGLIAINAAFAVFVLARGDIGETEGKILLTSLLATATAVLAMVCAQALAEGRVGRVPHVGIAAAVIGFVLVTIGIWSQIDSRVFGKSMATTYLIAAAAALAALLSAWPIAGRAAWVGRVAYVLVAAVAAALLTAMWFEIDSQGFWRGFAVLAVLLAAASLATPILHRAAPATGRESITRCPFCGSPIAGTTDVAVTCATCGRRFRVRLG